MGGRSLTPTVAPNLRLTMPSSTKPHEPPPTRKAQGQLCTSTLRKFRTPWRHLETGNDQHLSLEIQTSSLAV